MKIIFISNYFTHHQNPLSDALFELTKGNYIFLATEKMSDDRKSQGWTIDFPSYVIELDMKDKVSVNSYIQIINDADIVIQGHLYESLIKKRITSGKLTYIYNERLYKSCKRYLKLPLYYIKGMKQHNCYVLAASAFTPFDYSLTGNYAGRCYKFGYFPETKFHSNLDELFFQKERNRVVWVARLIDWKHPEVAIEMAKRLKKDGYDFKLEMIGTGSLLDDTKSKIQREGLSDFVIVTGAMTPAEVRKEMEAAGVFIFTSDKNEGWGAVLNEAMNSGCAVVAASKIGSVPYLLKNGENGSIYEDGNVEDLYKKVKYLMDNPAKQEEFGRKAYETITSLWDAQTAAENLIHLSENLINGKDTDIQEGPCSKAEIIKDNWYKCQ